MQRRQQSYEFVAVPGDRHVVAAAANNLALVGVQAGGRPVVAAKSYALATAPDDERVATAAVKSFALVAGRPSGRAAAVVAAREKSFVPLAAPGGGRVVVVSGKEVVSPCHRALQRAMLATVTAATSSLCLLLGSMASDRAAVVMRSYTTLSVAHNGYHKGPRKPRAGVGACARTQAQKGRGRRASARARKTQSRRRATTARAHLLRGRAQEYERREPRNR
jgi:hypothetical protein